MRTTVLTAVKTIWKIDRFYLLYQGIYNLVKQFFNVFYSVYFVRMLLNAIEAERDIGGILALLSFMLFVNIVFYSIDSHLKQVYIVQTQTRLKALVYEQAFAKAESIPYEEFNRAEFLDWYNRVLENTTDHMMRIVDSLGTTCGLALALPMVAGYLVGADPMAIVLCLISVGYSYLLGERGERARHDLDAALAGPARKKEYARRVFYLPEYAKEIKVTDAAEIAKEIYAQGAEESISTIRKRWKRIAALKCMELCIGDGLVVMLPIVYVAFRILTGSGLTAGDFVGIAQGIAIFSWDIQWLAEVVLAIRGSSLYVKDYVDFMGQSLAPAQEAGMQIPVEGSGWELSCRIGEYRYPGGKLALHDIDLAIRRGEKIAIVGENGAGKTTLALFLVNLLGSGQVYLNGMELGCIKREQRRRFIGAVTQDFHIYPLSVRENLCMNQALDDQAQWDALEKMGLRGQITDLGICLTKELDPDGLTLSGGQAQRLALARVVAGDCELVILDEPTSALDPITERDIDQLLIRAIKDRTVVIISHRMATTHLVDRIFVMKDGTIVEEGSHPQLMALKGAYWQMYSAYLELYGECAAAE